MLLRNRQQFVCPTTGSSSRHLWSDSISGFVSSSPADEKLRRHRLHFSDGRVFHHQIHLHFRLQKSDRKKRRFLVLFVQPYIWHSDRLVTDRFSNFAREKSVPVLPLLQPGPSESRRSQIKLSLSIHIRRNFYHLRFNSTTNNNL